MNSVGLFLLWVAAVEYASGNFTLTSNQEEIGNICEKDPMVCPEDSTTCIAKDKDDFYCRCLDEYELKEGQDPELNKDECIKKEECNFGFPMCPEDTTRCVPRGENDFYCECLPGYKLKEGAKKEENKDSCLKLSKCDTDLTICPSNTSRCMVVDFEEGYYCECLPGFKRNEETDDPYSKDICIRDEATETVFTVPNTSPPSCDCGPNSTRCYFNYEGDKVCECRTGHAQRNGFCEECRCGPKSTGCYFEKFGNKVCNCQNGYAQRGSICAKTCINNADCLYGGLCLKQHRGYFCSCRSGFTGDWCERHELCAELNKTCSYKQAACQYSNRTDGAFCECRFKYGNRRPVETCDDRCSFGSCVNGKCQAFGNYLQCKCNEGFTGPNCTSAFVIYEYNYFGYSIILGIIAIILLGFLSGTIYLCVDFSKLKKKKSQSGASLRSGSAESQNKQLTSA